MQTIYSDGINFSSKTVINVAWTLGMEMTAAEAAHFMWAYSEEIKNAAVDAGKERIREILLRTNPSAKIFKELLTDKAYHIIKKHAEELSAAYVEKGGDGVRDVLRKIADELPDKSQTKSFPQAVIKEY